MEQQQFKQDKSMYPKKEAYKVVVPAVMGVLAISLGAGYFYYANQAINGRHNVDVETIPETKEIVDINTQYPYLQEIVDEIEITNEESDTIDKYIIDDNNVEKIEESKEKITTKQIQTTNNDTNTNGEKEGYTFIDGDYYPNIVQKVGARGQTITAVLLQKDDGSYKYYGSGYTFDSEGKPVEQPVSITHDDIGIDEYIGEQTRNDDDKLVSYSINGNHRIKWHVSKREEVEMIDVDTLPELPDDQKEAIREWLERANMN